MPFLRAEIICEYSCSFAPAMATSLAEMAMDADEAAMNADSTSSAAEPEAAGPVTSVVTVFVSGKNPGEFSKVTSTVTLEAGEEFKRYRRDVSRPQPVLMTRAPESGLSDLVLQPSELLRDATTRDNADSSHADFIQSSLSDY